MDGPSTLALLSNVFVAISLAITAWSLRYISRQAAEASGSRRMAALREMVNELGTDEIRALRYKVMVGEYAVPFEHLTVDQKAEMRRLAVAYDRIGAMVRVGLDVDLFYDFHGHDAIMVWEAVKPAVYEIRKTRPAYLINAEQLAEATQVYIAGAGKPSRFGRKRKRVRVAPRIPGSHASSTSTSMPRR